MCLWTNELDACELTNAAVYVPSINDDADGASTNVLEPRIVRCTTGFHDAANATRNADKG